MLQKIAWSQGNYVRSLQYAQENIASYMNEWSKKSIYLYLGRAAISQGDLTQAEMYLRRSIPPYDWRFVTVYWWSLFTPQVLGWIALFSQQKKYSISARLIGAVDFDLSARSNPSLIPARTQRIRSGPGIYPRGIERRSFRRCFYGREDDDPRAGACLGSRGDAWVDE